MIWKRRRRGEFMQTLAERLKACNFKPSGFDYLRISLASMVIVAHTVNVAYGPEVTQRVWSTPMRIPFAVILPMFFALSGFLVAGSLERCRTLISFLGFRLFRLIPALLVETTLSALVLGSAFTTLPLGQYFKEPEFRVYFLNILGDIHYVLPGVFSSNPWPRTVNDQLWTLPFEMACYGTISVLAITTIFRRKYILLAGVVSLEIALLVYHTFFKPIQSGITIGGMALVVSFLSGLLCYQFRHKLPWSPLLLGLSVLITVLLVSNHATSYLCPLPAAYATVYLGMINPPRFKLLLTGDYSYGLFLYGYPIQQAVVAVLPGYRHWYVNLLIAWPLSLAVAVGSWWLVEKPIHDRRKVWYAIEAWVLTALGRSPKEQPIATL